MGNNIKVGISVLSLLALILLGYHQNSLSNDRISSLEEQNQILTEQAHKIVYRKNILQMIDCKIAKKEVIVKNWGDDSVVLYCGEEQFK